MIHSNKYLMNAIQIVEYLMNTIVETITALHELFQEIEEEK